MRVLVTGGLGFVGRAVTLDLIAHGHQVDVLSRDSTAPPPTTARLLTGDIRDRERLLEIVLDGHYEGICHLAAATRPADSIADPLTYYDVNLAGTLNLLLALRDTTQENRHRVRVVNASTSIVYGSTHPGALAEDLTPAPESPYGASKVAAEQLITHYAATNAISAITLRCFNVAGAVDNYPDTDPTRIIPNVLRAIRGELPHVTLNGDGSAIREFTHVLDVATAFRLALEAQGHRTHQIYNVGTGHGVAIRDVIGTAEQVTGKPVPVRHLPPRPEPHTLISDARRLVAELGWSPVHSKLSEIIESAWRATGTVEGKA